MDKNQSISPELNELLKRVKSQANQYTQAFEILNRRIAEFDSTKTEINSHASHFKTELSVILSKLEQSYKEKENKLIASINAANKLTGELSTLTELQEHVKTGILNLSDTLESHKLELEQLKLHSKEYVKDAYLKLDDTLEYLKQKINSTLEKEAQFIEDKVNSRVKYLEDNLKKGDKILISRHEKVQTELRAIKREVQALKELSGFGETSSMLNDTLNLRFETVEDSVKDLKQLSNNIMQNLAILNVAETSEHVENDTDDAVLNDTFSHLADPTMKESEEIKEALNKYNSTIQEFQYMKQKSLSAEKRAGISMILSVFAILSILMILFLFLI